jgi:hypothetical protein
VKVPTVVVAVEEDRLVPRADLVALAEGLPCARRLHLLRSRFGHDAFLTEHEAIAQILRGRAAGVPSVSAPALSTRAVRAGIDQDAAFGAVVPPLVLSSNFSFAGFGRKRPLRLHAQRQSHP